MKKVVNTVKLTKKSVRNLFLENLFTFLGLEVIRFSISAYPPSNKGSNIFK